LTVTVERIDGGKLRCTGATWTDAVVIFPGEVLGFQNIERQAHALRAPAPGGVVKDPPAGGKAFYAPSYHPGRGWERDLGPMTREQAIAKAQEVRVGTTTSAAAFVKMLEVLGVTVEGIDGGKLRRDLGRCRSGPPPTRGSVTPRSGEDDFEAAPDEGRNTVVVLLPASPDLVDRYSITSSASASSLSGTVRPSALAVLRLMTSSNLTRAWTGSSLGFSPLRTRST
jgi:hypothetical protein